jgi:CHASE2 domain-containing sensor protein
VAIEEYWQGGVEDVPRSDRFDWFYCCQYSRSLFTPFSDSDLTASPGVEIHAYIIDHFLAAAIDGAPILYGWAEPQEMAWILAWAANWCRNGGRLFLRRRLAGLMVFAIAGLVVVILPFGLFLIGSWGPIPASLGSLFGQCNLTAGWFCWIICNVPIASWRPIRKI